MGVLSLVCIYIIHLTYESQEKSAISIKRLIKIVRRKEHPSDRFNEERCKQKKCEKNPLSMVYVHCTISTNERKNNKEKREEKKRIQIMCTISCQRTKAKWKCVSLFRTTLSITWNGRQCVECNFFSPCIRFFSLVLFKLNIGCVCMNTSRFKLKCQHNCIPCFPSFILFLCLPLQKKLLPCVCVCKSIYSIIRVNNASYTDAIANYTSRFVGFACTNGY